MEYRHKHHLCDVVDFLAKYLSQAKQNRLNEEQSSTSEMFAAGKAIPSQKKVQQKGTYKQ
jgi:hypothetical protein